MALKTFVKIGNVTNLSDARYCAGMGVDLIGFRIDPESRHYMSPEKAVEIAEWLSGVDFVAEYHGNDIEEVKRVIERYPVTHIEYIHPELTHAIVSLGYTSIYRSPFSKQADNGDFRETILFCGQMVDYVLIDKISDYQDERVLQELQEYCDRFSVIIAGEFDANDILQVLEKVPAKGIALKGSEEIKPGLKDFDGLADILEVLEVDDLE